MWHGGAAEQGRSAQQRIFWGLNQALGLAGYHAVFLDLGDLVRTEEVNAEREAAHLRYVMEHAFGGVIFYPYAYKSNHDLIREVAQKLPLVLLDRTLPGISADFVGSSNHDALLEATNTLIERGHRRIAYITTAEPINPVQERLQGYLSAIQHSPKTHGYEAVLTVPGEPETPWPTFRALMRAPADERPTAILCVNDYTALRVVDELTAMNLRVPEDISLVGFDDLVETLPGGVGLSSVGQPFEEIGRTAAELFIRRAENPSAPLTYAALPTQLILRESVASLA